MEFLLHLWDEFDDVVGACRHVATSAAAEVLATATPLIAAASTVVLAGAAALLLAQRQFLSITT